MKTLSLILSVTHSLSALTLLIFSGWFIAACAISGADYAQINFNYLLPAVIIRALALIRISSGYAQMWTGHNALLKQVKNLRINLFTRLKQQRITRQAQGTEALAQHSESIAGITMAWSVHNLAAAFSISLASLVIFTFLPAWLTIWLAFLSALILILGLGIRRIKRNATRLVKLKTQYRHDSEHHLASASLWHLHKRLTHPNMQKIYHLIGQQQGHGERMLWWVQATAFILLLYLLSTKIYQGQAMAMVLVLLLLAAKDWLAPLLHSQTALADFQESRHSFKHLPLQTIETASLQPEKIKQLVLHNFSVLNRPIQTIELTLQAGEIVLLKGSSGSGKTSLLKAIAGLLTHTGKKWVNGQEIPTGFITTWHYCEQQPLALSASLAANLRLANPNASEQQLKCALDFADLTHLTDLSQWIGEQGRQLSGGELKRLNIARAYLLQAQCYLLDEPFEGLNTEQQQKLANAIKQLATTAPIIIASHIVPHNLTPQTKILLEPD